MYKIVETGSVAKQSFHFNNKVFDVINVRIMNLKNLMVTYGAFVLQEDRDGRYIDFTATQFKNLGIVYLGQLGMA